MFSEKVRVKTKFHLHESSTESNEGPIARSILFSVGEHESRGRPVDDGYEEFQLTGEENIDIILIDKNGEPVLRRPFYCCDKQRHYFFKFNTTSSLFYNIVPTKYGWQIRRGNQKSLKSISDPVISDKLPKKWFMLPLRFLLLSVEWPYYILKSFWFGIILTLKVMGYNVNLSLIEPENTSVTVGDEEE